MHANVCAKGYEGLVFVHPTGHCMANEQYIGQLKDTFATSVPSRIAAFFAEPIQVPRSAVEQEHGVRIINTAHS